MAKYYRDTPEGRIPFTPEQKAQRDAEIAAAKTKLRKIDILNIRNKRNKLLKETDWLFLSDVEILNSEEWKKYRQDLRDVPQQDSFPNKIIWPIKPKIKSKN